MLCTAMLLRPVLHLNAPKSGQPHHWDAYHARLSSIPCTPATAASSGQHEAAREPRQRPGGSLGTASQPPASTGHPQPGGPRADTRCPRRDEGPPTARVPRIIFRSSSGSRFPRAVERGAGCGGAAPARPSASECGAAEESAASRRPRAGCAVARRRCRFNGPLRAAPRHKAGRPGGQGAERRSRGSAPAPQRHTVGWLRL